MDHSSSSIGALLQFRDEQAVALTLRNAANHLYRAGTSDSELAAMRMIDIVRSVQSKPNCEFVCEECEGKRKEYNDGDVWLV